MATCQRHMQVDCRTAAPLAGCASEQCPAWADTAFGRHHAGVVAAEPPQAQGVPDGKDCGTLLSAAFRLAAVQCSSQQADDHPVSSQPPTPTPTPVSMTGVSDGPTDYTSAFERCQPLLRPKALKLAPFPASPEAQEASRRLLALVPGAGLPFGPHTAAC